MFTLASKLIGLPIMALQNGEVIAKVKYLVLEPNKLQLVGIKCELQPGISKNPIVLTQDIRQVALDCVLVNSTEDITDSSDIVRLEPLLKINLQLRGIRVLTESKKYVGKCEDYTINLGSFMLQKIYIRQSPIKSFFGASLIIDRSQIVQVSNREIIVKDASILQPARDKKVNIGKPIPKQQ